MRGGHWSRALLLIALTCVTRSSRADSQALALDYDADATCPDQEAFSALVLEKLAANCVAEGSSTRPQIAAHIHATSAGFVGQLALRRSDASSYDREVTGTSCTEVANALAFVLALALGTKEATASSAEPAPSAVVAPPPVPAVKEPPRASTAAQPTPRPAEERRSLWRLGAGAQVGERGGLGASTITGSAFLEARRVAHGPFGFTFRAGFSSAQTASRHDPNGTTNASWWAGNLEVCPLRLQLLGPLALLPCAGADVGRLRIKGSPSSAPGSSGDAASKLWVDGFAGVRLELSLARWLALEVQSDLLVPLTRYRFEFRPNTDAYRIPGLALAGLAGLAAHFP
jgi:hypothetical protein